MVLNCVYAKIHGLILLESLEMGYIYNAKTQITRILKYGKFNQE